MSEYEEYFKQNERFKKDPEGAIQYLEESIQAFEISRKILDEAKAKRNEEIKVLKEKEDFKELVAEGLKRYQLWKSGFR